MRRINIGFEGGGAIAARLDDDALEGLRSALQGGGGWHRLDTADGRVDLKLDEVVYVSESSKEPRVGFGGPAA
jgi:hypothetical protein